MCMAYVKTVKQQFELGGASVRVYEEGRRGIMADMAIGKMPWYCASGIH